LDASLSATARPPASSAGEVIRLPEDKRPKLLRRASLDLLRLKEAVVAAEFVFTTIGTGYSFLVVSATSMTSRTSSWWRETLMVSCIFSLRFGLVI
jgi:hypothetical protein